MKKLLFLFIVLLFSGKAHSKDKPIPDTVDVGIYITSIHDIDFRQKEYMMNLWLWLKYKRPEFDFVKNLEVPMAKSFEKSYATIDTLEDGTLYLLMKLQCVMKGTWRINAFPFDRQRLRFGIENSMFDASELVYKADTFGNHYGRWFLTGWEKDSFNLRTSIRKYETGFGDPSLAKPESEYGTFSATIVIHRESWELFAKMFLGMYISFMIAFICFYIHPDNMDSRLALSVGALFAVVGNKYIVDSSLPESSSFTLVDTLHGITLFYIFCVIASSVHTLRLVKRDEISRARRHNRIAALVLLGVYVLLNLWFIYNAVDSTPAVAN